MRIELKLQVVLYCLPCGWNNSVFFIPVVKSESRELGEMVLFPFSTLFFYHELV